MANSRQLAAEATRAKIINAAFDIIGKDGYEGLTSNQIVKVAGVAKGTLYHHFGGIEDVICAVISQVIEGMMNDVPISQFPNMRDYLKALGHYNLYVLTSDKVILNVLYGFIPKGINNPKFKTLSTGLIEVACAQVNPAISNFYGEKVSPEKINKAVRMVDIFSIGIGIHDMFFDDKSLYEQIWTDFSEMLIGYLEN